MVKLSNNVVLEVVRAFPTSEEVQREHRIFSNFSARLVVDGVPVVSLNDLSIRLSRDNQLFIGSQGRKFSDGTIWAVGFFPKGHDLTEKEEAKQIERGNKLVEDLAEEIATFIKKAQARLVEREAQPIKLSATAAKLAAIKPLTPRGKQANGDKATEGPQAKGGKDFSDIPF